MATVLEELLIALRVDDGKMKAELARIVDQARKAGGEGEKALKPFETGLSRMAAEARAGLRPLSDLRAELKKQETDLKSLAAAQDKNSGEYRKTVEQLTSVKRELASVTVELKTQESLFDKLGGTMTRVGGVLSLGVTAPLTILGTTGVRSAMQLEVFQKSLETLIGDAGEAKQVFEDLYEFDTKTTFSWPSLTKATTLLSAFNVEAHDLIPTLGRLGDISSAVQMDVAELADTYGRMKVSGRVTMLELNQLMGRGIPIVQELAANLGVSEGEIKTLASTGKLSFGDIERAFQTMTAEGGRFHDMMKSQTDTTQGRVMALRKEFEQVTDQIGDALLPTLDGLVDRARKAVQWFVDLDEGTQKLVINTGLFAAALGPLLIGLGQAVRVAGQLRTAFVALRAAGLLMAGPTGWVVLGIAAVGGLAIALSGRGDSLDAAVTNANRALARGDADSLTGALQEVSDRLAPSDPLRTRIAALQDELRTTGEVGVQAAKDIAAALQAAAIAPLKLELQALQESVAKREGLLAAVTGDSGARSARLAEIEAIGNKILDEGGIVPQDLMDELQQLRLAADDLGMTSAEVARQEARLSADRVRIKELEAQIAGVETPKPDPTNDGDKDKGGGDPNAVQKRVAALRAELAAMQREVDVGLADAATLAERSAQAVDGALRDLIRLGADDGVLDALLGDKSTFEAAVRDRAKLLAPIIRAEMLDERLRIEQEQTDQAIRGAQQAIRVAEQKAESERLGAVARAPLIRAAEWDAAWFAERDAEEAQARRASAESTIAQNRQARDRQTAVTRAPLNRAEEWDLAWFAEQAEIASMIAENEARAIIKANNQALNERLAAAAEEAQRRGAASANTQTLLRFGQDARWSAPGALEAFTNQAARQGGGAVPIAMPSVFSGLDSEQTKFVNKVRGDLAAAMDLAAAKAEALGDAYDLPKEQLRLTQAAIVQLIEGGLNPANPAVQALAGDFEKFAAAIQAVADQDARVKAFKDAVAFAKDALGELPGPLEQNINALRDYRESMDMSEEGANALAVELDRLIDALERLQGIEDSGLRKFAGDVTNLAGSLPGLGGAFARSTGLVAEGLHKIAETDDKLGGTAMVIRGVTSAIESIMEASKDGGLDGNQTMELIGGIASVAAEAVGALTGIPGLGEVVSAAFGLITLAVGDLSDGLAEIEEQIESTGKRMPLLARNTLDAFAAEYTRQVSAGGSFGRTKAELDTELFDAAIDLAGSFATTFATALAAADFEDSLDLGFDRMIRGQLIEAFILSPEVQAQIRALVEFWQEAWEDGKLTEDERKKWETLRQGLIESGRATREQLKELGLLDDEQTKKARTGGARITDLTGPARDHFSDLLAPLRHLGAQLSTLQDIRNLLDARLPKVGSIGSNAAGAGGQVITIDTVRVEGVRDVRTLFDQLSLIAKRVDRGR